MRFRLAAALVAPLLFSTLLVACSSAGDGVPPAPAPTSAPAATTSTAAAAAPASSGPGTVTLEVSGVTGARDLLLLGLISPTVPGQAMAALCQPVAADPFSFSGALLPVTGDNPCALGTEPMQFDPGTYTMVVAAIRGGDTTPQQCTEVDVTVAGDVTVAVTTLGPPSDCSF